MSAESRGERLFAAASSTPGFLSRAEGAALRRIAHRASALGRGPLLEIGSYLGRSGLFLAAGIADAGGGNILFSVDHHHGSEEMQAGWPNHDATLVDERTGRMDSLARWRSGIEDAEASDLIVGVVGDSARIASAWQTPLSLVFIDGGHAEAVEWADYRSWAPKLAPGGLLAIHDVFEDAAEGGRPPYACYLDAVASGRFEEDTAERTESLRVLIANP